jgi:nitrogen PTS system EIIA component
VKIADMIGKDNVIADLRAADKAQLLGELSRRAAASVGIEQDVILKALRAREDLGSTGLGRGFALPHARIDLLPRFFALFARLARPIDFAAIDDRPVDLVVLLLIPAKAGNEHLAALAAISRPLRDQAFVQRLRDARGAEALHLLLAGT